MVLNNCTGGRVDCIVSSHESGSDIDGGARRPRARSTVLSLLAAVSTVALSAAPRYLADGTPPQHWVGQSEQQLITRMGTPDITFPDGDGSQTIRYVAPWKSTHDGEIHMVQQFDVDSSGRVISASVSMM